MAGRKARRGGPIRYRGGSSVVLTGVTVGGEPTSTFIRFAPGAVKPIGQQDVDRFPGTGLVRNVGCRVDPSTLTVVNGDLTIAPGQTYTGLDIYGRIKGQGDSATLVQDCIARGPGWPAGYTGTPSISAAYGTGYNFGGAVFEYVTFDNRGRESPWAGAIDGGGYVWRYCEARRWQDGIGWNSFGNATIECSRVGDGYYAAWWDDTGGAPRTVFPAGTGVLNYPVGYPTPPASGGTGDTHPDACQIQGFSGWVIRGSYLGGTRTGNQSATQLDPTVVADQAIIAARDATGDHRNAALMVNGKAANPVGALIELNWFEGGQATINLAGVTGDTLGGMTIQDNRIIRPAVANSIVSAAAGDAAVKARNVWDDTGLPVASGW